MRFIVDMNLTPKWVPFLQNAGHKAKHWSNIGLPDAPDEDLLACALERSAVLLTQDLDFGAILVASGAHGPSVLQLREKDPDPAHVGQKLLAAIKQYERQLEQGALITIDLRRAKARILPIRAD